MTTEIKLEHPYSSLWKKGYLNVNSDGRRTLSLYNTPKDRSSCQYARYLISIKEGRFLLSSEHVDHIDGNKTNDSIDNLQILSMTENNKKSHKKDNVCLICPVCNVQFERTLTQLRGRKHKVKNNQICCSRKCGGVYSFKEKL